IRDFHVTGVQTCALPIYSRLDDLARAMMRQGDTRTKAQLRADALVDVLLRRDGQLLRAFGDAKPTVVATVPMSVLEGHDDAMCEIGRWSCREGVWGEEGR